MRERGHDVSGSDRTDSALLEDLRSQGIATTLKQDGSNLPKNIDLFVYSEAIPQDSPERKEAERRSIRQISYFQAIGELTAGSNLIAVCGTHGKSSTTAMAASVLIAAGFDPSVIVGTKLPLLGGKNWRRGAGDLWIVEACEYRRSFLHLKPKMILLTNADGDHFDYFRDPDDYHAAFVEFVSSLPADGIVIAHGKDEQSMKIVSDAKKKWIDADLLPLPILSIPGIHMQKNALLVSALGKHLGISETVTANALQTYAGSWRRMEVKGTVHGITVIDDYAHHPLEIRATLSAMREKFAGRRIVAVFQPHTNHRTLKLWDDFASSFTDADAVMVTSIYGARAEKDTEKADESAFAEAIFGRSRKHCIASGSLEKTEQILCSDIAKTGDVIVIMGAGDSTNLSDSLISSLPSSSVRDHVHIP